jgi:uncharacterized metal-binding protein YceD (DUF177 family)
MTKPLRFDAAAIRERGSFSFQGAVPPEEVQALLGGEVLLQGPLLARLELTWRAGEVDFQGKVAGSWQMECSRCLALSLTGYEVGLEGTLQPAGGVVDLTEDLRQALVLAAPMQSRCKPDCRGLCPKCRIDRNLKDCGCAVA